ASRLRALDLFGTEVGDDGLAHLAGLTELRALYLESTRVGDAGVAHLRKLTRLERLALSGTRVSDACLTHLTSLAALKAVDLSYTAVTPAGVDQLRRALPGAEVTADDLQGRRDFCANPESQESKISKHLELGARRIAPGQ